MTWWHSWTGQRLQSLQVRHDCSGQVWVHPELLTSLHGKLKLNHTSSALCFSWLTSIKIPSPSPKSTLMGLCCICCARCGHLFSSHPSWRIRECWRSRKCLIGPLWTQNDSWSITPLRTPSDATEVDSWEEKKSGLIPAHQVIGPLTHNECAAWRNNILRHHNYNCILFFLHHKQHGALVKQKADCPAAEATNLACKREFSRDLWVHKTPWIHLVSSPLILHRAAAPAINNSLFGAG